MTKSNNDFFSRDEILAADDLPFEDVPINEWGGKKVRINAMTAARGAKYLKGSSGLDYDERFARLVVFTATDSNGEYIFSEADIPALCEKSLDPVYRLAQVAMDLNGMGSDVDENLD